MGKLYPLTVCLWAVAFTTRCADGDGVVFHADYDRYSVTADVARGNGESPDFPDGLMLRMFGGRKEGLNALMLSNGETVRYDAPGNLDLRQGTVTLWIAPKGWTASEEKERRFFDLQLPGIRFSLLKFSRPRDFGFEFTWNDAPVIDKTAVADIGIPDKLWRDGEWHRFDATWSEKGGINFYLDGERRNRSGVPGRYPTPSALFSTPWTGLPAKIEKGTIVLGGSDAKGGVAFDEVTILDRPLTDAEIRADFAKSCGEPLPPEAEPHPPREYSREPYEMKCGIDSTVPDPWTDIKRLGELRFGVLMREYAFGKGPFPTAVTVEGESVLAAAPAYRLATADGEAAIVWDEAKVEDFRRDRVILSGRGEGGGLIFSWRGELWFDGAYLVKVTAEPKADAVEIAAFDLNWTVPAKHSKYLLTDRAPIGTGGNVTVKWDKSYERDFYSYPYRGETLIWLTGNRKGFSWIAESDANCVHAKDSKPVKFVRTAEGDAAVTVQYVNTPAKLAKKAEWSLVFDATPVRTPMKNYRDFRNGEMRFTKNQNAAVFSWTTFHKWLSPQDQTHPASHLPRDPEAFGKEVARMHAHNAMKLFPYNQIPALGTPDAEWDTCLDDWQLIPSRYAANSKNGVRWETRQTCPKTDAADLMAYRFEKAMVRYGKDGLGGDYFDLCDCVACENGRHGCGGIDAFGRPYKTNIAIGLRNFLMRIYKIAHRHGGLVFNHAHNYFVPMTHAFTDVWYPGEQHHSAHEKNPEWFYTEEVTPYELEGAWNPQIKGTVMSVLLRSDGVKKGPDDTCPEHTVKAMAPFIVHDCQISFGKCDRFVVERWWQVCVDVKLSESDFHGYWEDGAEKLSTNEKVMASAYTWKTPSPYTKLIVAHNRSREPQRGLVAPPAGAKCRDLWNGRDLTPAEVAEFTIPPGAFAAIGVID